MGGIGGDWLVRCEAPGNVLGGFIYANFIYIYESIIQDGCRGDNKRSSLVLTSS